MTDKNAVINKLVDDITTFFKYYANRASIDFDYCELEQYNSIFEKVVNIDDKLGIVTFDMQSFGDMLKPYLNKDSVNDTLYIYLYTIFDVYLNEVKFVKDVHIESHILVLLFWFYVISCSEYVLLDDLVSVVANLRRKRKSILCYSQFYTYCIHAPFFNKDDNISDLRTLFLSMHELHIVTYRGSKGEYKFKPMYQVLIQELPL